MYYSTNIDNWLFELKILPKNATFFCKFAIHKLKFNELKH